MNRGDLLTPTRVPYFFPELKFLSRGLLSSGKWERRVLKTPSLLTRRHFISFPSRSGIYNGADFNVCDHLLQRHHQL